MELIRTLIRDKWQASGPSPQNETAQPDQRKEEPIYSARFTPAYALNVHMAQAPSMPQTGAFLYDYAPPPVRVNETGQSSGGNEANSIKISNLDDPTVIEKIRQESIE